jgi:mevalonate kinase
MAKGTGFGKTILIGDQFVLEGVPAIVSAISFETVAIVERINGDGWVLEDMRIEVPGYKEKKKQQQARSIDRILEAEDHRQEDPDKDYLWRNLVAEWGSQQPVMCPRPCAKRRIPVGLFD